MAAEVPTPLNTQISNATAFLAPQGDPMYMYRGIEVLAELPRGLDPEMDERIKGMKAQLEAAKADPKLGFADAQQLMIRLGGGIILSHLSDNRPEAGRNALDVYKSGVKKYSKYNTSLATNGLLGVELTPRLEQLVGKGRVEDARWLRRYAQQARVGNFIYDQLAFVHLPKRHHARS